MVLLCNKVDSIYLNTHSDTNRAALQVHWQMKSLKVNFDMKIGQTSATEVQKGMEGNRKFTP